MNTPSESLADRIGIGHFITGAGFIPSVGDELHAMDIAIQVLALEAAEERR